jgi:hypothetical protein
MESLKTPLPKSRVEYGLRQQNKSEPWILGRIGSIWLRAHQVLREVCASMLR